MKYFVIAGEPSGDQHAACLIQALKARDAAADFCIIGGEHMMAEAGDSVIPLNQLAFMGFTQILFHLGQIRRNFKFAKKALMAFQPDVLILVDYPGFNLRMAKWAKKKGFKVYYYIAPKVWAWNTRRVKKIKQYTDRVFSILPFEVDFFKSHGVSVDYVGNPVYEQISQQYPDQVDAQNQPQETGKALSSIALLPGSRTQEIQRILPEMLKTIPHFIQYQFVIAGMRQHQKLYEELLPGLENVRVDYSGSLSVLNQSAAALVTSGTATLETAIMGVPQLVCYKTNQLSYLIAKQVIKVPYISLVNLLLGGPGVPELIQSHCTERYLVSGLKHILPDGANREAQIELSDRIRTILKRTNASDYLAELIISSLNHSS